MNNNIRRKETTGENCCCNWFCLLGLEEEKEERAKLIDVTTFPIQRECKVEVKQSPSPIALDLATPSNILSQKPEIEKLLFKRQEHFQFQSDKILQVFNQYPSLLNIDLEILKIVMSFQENWAAKYISQTLEILAENPNLLKEENLLAFLNIERIYECVYTGANVIRILNIYNKMQVLPDLKITKAFFDIYTCSDYSMIYLAKKLDFAGSMNPFQSNNDYKFAFKSYNSLVGRLCSDLSNEFNEKYLTICFNETSHAALKKLWTKILIASFTIQALFGKGNDGINRRFKLNEQAICKVLNQCTFSSLEPILQASEARYKIKEILNLIFISQEEELLKQIPFQKLQNRNELVVWLEKLSSAQLTQGNSYVIEKLLIQAKVWCEMEKNAKLKDFPFKEIWRFCIDGCHEKKGPFYYEDEPGCIVGLLNGLLWAFQNKGTPSLEKYDELHNLIIDNVFRKSKTFTSDWFCTPFCPFDKGFTEKVWDFGLSADRDKIGLADIHDRSDIATKNANLSDLIATKQTNKVIHPFYFYEGKVNGVDMSALGSIEYVRKKFTKMNAFLPGKNPVLRLIAFIELARELELMHILPDANGRTAMMLLYQLIANDPDIPMILFHNPNILEANGPEKVLYRMLQSMEKFKYNGLWEKANQVIEGHLFLKDLTLDFPELMAFRDQCIKEISQMPTWEIIHIMIEGDTK